MATLQVDSLSFIFQASITARKYDDSKHFLDVWGPRGGQAAVDIVAMKLTAIPDSAWLIEAKDFRVIRGAPRPTNIQGLARTMAKKVTDTQAGLVDAAANVEDPGQRQHAARALAARRRGEHTKLFPSNFPGGVLQKLRQLVRDIDPAPLVLDIANTPRAGVPWAVS